MNFKKARYLAMGENLDWIGDLEADIAAHGQLRPQVSPLCVLFPNSEYCYHLMTAPKDECLTDTETRTVH